MSSKVPLFDSSGVYQCYSDSSASYPYFYYPVPVPFPEPVPPPPPPPPPPPADEEAPPLPKTSLQEEAAQEDSHRKNQSGDQSKSPLNLQHLNNAQRPSGSYSPRPNETVNNYKLKPYRCDLCSIGFDDGAELEKHKEGIPHKAKLVEIEKERGNKLLNASSASNNAEEDDDDDDWSRCKLCATNFQSERDFNMHCRGMVHVQRQMEYDEKKRGNVGTLNSHSIAAVPPPPAPPPPPPPQVPSRRTRQPLMQDSDWDTIAAEQQQKRPNGSYSNLTANQSQRPGPNPGPGSFNSSQNSQTWNRGNYGFESEDYYVEPDYWEEEAVFDYPNQRAQQVFPLPEKLPDQMGRPIVNYYCDACQCPCSGQEAWESHLNGKRHKKTLESFKGSRDRGIPSVAVKQNISANFLPPPGPAALSHQPAEFQKRLDAFTQEPVMGIEFVAEHTWPGLKEPIYVCELCEARCQPINLIPHLIGIKHRLKALKELNFERYEQVKAIESKQTLVESLFQAAAEIEEKFGRSPLRQLIGAPPEFMKKTKEEKRKEWEKELPSANSVLFGSEIEATGSGIGSGGILERQGGTLMGQKPQVISRPKAPFIRGTRPLESTPMGPGPGMIRMPAPPQGIHRMAAPPPGARQPLIDAHALGMSDPQYEYSGEVGWNEYGGEVPQYGDGYYGNESDYGAASNPSFFGVGPDMRPLPEPYASPVPPVGVSRRAPLLEFDDLECSPITRNGATPNTMHSPAVAFDPIVPAKRPKLGSDYVDPSGPRMPLASPLASAAFGQQTSTLANSFTNTRSFDNPALQSQSSMMLSSNSYANLGLNSVSQQLLNAPGGVDPDSLQQMIATLQSGADVQSEQNAADAARLTTALTQALLKYRLQKLLGRNSGK